MIVSVAFKNFYSFKERTELSFELGKKPPTTKYDIRFEDKLTNELRRLNKVVAVIGPNGSGKTQFIKSIAFIDWFITESFLGSKPTEKIPFQPHKLNKNEPSEFEFTFIHNSEQYKYQLSAFSDKVVSESLFKKTSSQYSYLFIRELEGIEDSGKHKYNYKHKDFDFKPMHAKTVRRNASLISAAYNYDSSVASIVINVFKNIMHNLNVHGRAHYNSGYLFEASEFFKNNPSDKDLAEKLLCEMDLGIKSFTIEKGIINSEENIDEELFVPVSTHVSDSETFKLPFFEESSGTQSAFVLLRRLLPALEKGGLAVIDEIDNDLHPLLLPFILDLFKKEDTNPNNAQLVFTCHTPEVLNLLMKHQVYLVEKIEQSSEAWRLDEVVGLRADDNIYAKYMAGALSAVPEL